MTLTTKNSALVAGTSHDPQQEKAHDHDHDQVDADGGDMRVLRAICMDGERIEVGEIVHDIDPSTAGELISAGKAERVPAKKARAKQHDDKKADDHKPAAKSTKGA